MPITLTFDIEEASVKDQNDRTRILLAFKRFGWEHIGGSCWRYPSLSSGSQHPSEDWFNHVVPALMYFRAMVEHSGMNVTQFTLDAHAEAGYRQSGPVGRPIIPGAGVIQAGYPTGCTSAVDATLSARRLEQFVTGVATLLSPC